MYSIDIFVQNYFSLIRTVHLTEFMYLLSTLFDFSLPFILICICLTVLIYILKNFRYALLFAFTLSFGAILVYLLKIFFNVNRPTDAVMSAFGQSFPSGHATAATIFFVMLMYIFDPVVESTHYRAGSHNFSFGRIIFNTLCVAVIILVGFSRIYLGVHWASDVAFGVLLGALVSYFSIIIAIDNNKLTPN